MPPPGPGEGQGSERHRARAQSAHGVLGRDGGEHGVGLVGLHQAGGAPADQGQAGAVEEDGGAAVELQGVGPVGQRDRAGVEPLGHGVPVRVARTSWLRPPARGRMPTPE